MTLTITIILLSVGLIHAIWNALLKANKDTITMLGVLFGTMGVIALIAVFFVPPITNQILPYLLATTIVHIVYKFGIIKMYQHGDLSLVYPIARGIAPVIVMILALLFANEIPTYIQIAGIIIICTGLFGFLGNKAYGAKSAIGYAILTGVTIAGYTFLDGMGSRIANNVFSFAAWVFIFDGFGTLLMVILIKRKQFLPAAKPILKTAIPAGAMAGFSYVAVMWALSQGNMASVSAIREISVVFAAIIGTVFLNEPMGKRRIFASLIVLFGIIILNI